MSRTRRSGRLRPLLAGMSIALAAASAAASSGTPAFYFEANQGQADGRVRFLARGRDFGLYLFAAGAALDLDGKGLARIELDRAAPRGRPEGLDPLPSHSNYFVGNDPTRWRTGVPHYARVRYREVYPGIDLVYDGRRGELEFDFLLAPGSVPERIALRFPGAKRLEIARSGDLHVKMAGGALVLRRPVAYQEAGGRRNAVQARFVRLPRGRAGFEVDDYDRTRPLVIDPVLSYSTFLGGGAGDSGLGIATDVAGNAYVCGRTLSLNFPRAGAVQGSFGGGSPNGDAFVAKLAPAGNALLYSTYLGGSSDDLAAGVAVDPAGNAYVAGSTRSANFPTANAMQATFGGNRDAFVVKLSASGNAFVYSTYSGGSGDESYSDVAVDGAGSAYLVGSVPGSGPTVNTDAVLAKLNPAGSAFVYNLAFNTSLAGIPLNDFGDGVAVDPAGNAYFGGDSGLASIGARNQVLAVALGPSGQTIYAVTFGGSDDDEARDIAVDNSGNAYLTGFTESTDFPTTAGAFQATRPTGLNGDAFVSRLNPTGGLSYSTYLGGIDREGGNGIAVDASGSAWVAGFTESPNFPLAGATQPAYGGMRDAFLAQIGPSGATLSFSTFLGGGQSEIASAVAVDRSGNPHVTGGTSSTAFPTLAALQAVKSGGEDAFVLRFGGAAPPAACTQDATKLCLNAARFRVEVSWSAANISQSGVGQAIPLTSDTGYFWFFSSSNIELVIKVVDGRAFNGFIWVFYGALSDVNYTITVTDTVTGAVKVYTNSQGNLASVADVAAFSGGP